MRFSVWAVSKVGWTAEASSSSRPPSFGSSDSEERACVFLPKLRRSRLDLQPSTIPDDFPFFNALSTITVSTIIKSMQILASPCFLRLSPPSDNGLLCSVNSCAPLALFGLLFLCVISASHNTGRKFNGRTVDCARTFFGTIVSLFASPPSASVSPLHSEPLISEVTSMSSSTFSASERDMMAF
jgi:hypothetical protein